MRNKSAGFSLIELLAVVGIIMVMAAVAVPAMSRYFRNYQVQGAAQQVASEIGLARTRAIMRNVNRAGLFVVIDDRNYRWVLPEQTVPAGGAFSDVGTLLANPVTAGTLRTLPEGLRFDDTGATTSVMGFTRLGAQCDPGTTACASPSLDLTGAPAANYIVFDAATGASTITLVQDSTALRRRVTVTSGGRVLSEQ
jgi:Tfp pilus assembly protein FimT